MTIDALIYLLAEYRDEFGPGAEVRLMTQQNWPFENRICGLTSGAEMHESDVIDEDDNPADNDNVVYIVEGGQICYGNRRAWETARES